MVDDSADGEIGEHGVVWAGMARSRTAGGENPVALPGAHGINGNQFLALVVHKNAQMHVIQTGNAEGADQRVGYLHDLHQPAEPPDGLVEGEELGEGEAVFGGSGSQ